MGQFKESNRKQINIAASNFLSDQEEGDNYDAYLKLQEESEKGNDDCCAADYVTVWQPLEHLTVAKMIQTIENSIVSLELPEFLTKIDWEDLKGQKSVLLTLLEVIENTKPQPVKSEGSEMVVILVPKEMTNALNGILHLIDSIQDDAVDKFGMDENKVFDLHLDEDDYERDDDENCKYCGQKCWKGQMCDEQQAGGFNNVPKVKPTGNKFKVWVDIERIETDAEGNETYYDEECPIGIGMAYYDTLQEAVSLQNLIQNNFGEI